MIPIFLSFSFSFLDTLIVFSRFPLVLYIYYIIITIIIIIIVYRVHVALVGLIKYSNIPKLNIMINTCVPRILLYIHLLLLIIIIITTYY